MPKGRLLEALAPLLLRAGLPTGVLEKAGRSLVREDPAGGYRYLLLKPNDVPTYVEHGTCEVGFVGRDVLVERGHDLYCPVDLGVGRCRIVLAGPEAGPPPPSQPRVATKYVNVTQSWFASRGQPIHLIPLSGSVELAPLSGLADLVVDIVETGETLRQNHLAVLETICEVTAVMVVNRSALKLRRARIVPLIRAVRSASRFRATPPRG